jgi:hypothetical protein
VHVNEQVREFIRSAQRSAEITFSSLTAKDPTLETLLLTLAKR